jgi:hypothetical protein
MFASLALRVLLVMVVFVRAEEDQAAGAPDHQHDEGETEEQIELRFLE